MCGFKLILLIATGSPFSNVIIISSDLSKESSKDFVLEKTCSGAGTQGSSSILPSEDVCNKLAAVLNGISPFLSYWKLIW